MLKNNYSLKFTPKVSEDLDKIYNYIFQDLYVGGAAKKLLEKIETSIMRLQGFPFSCNYVADEFLRKKSYRKLIIDNHIAFYLINEEEQQVIIMRVLYGRQKYQDLL